MQFNANAHQGGGGSGLGLYISKKIADLHQARLSLSSVVGRGSTFTLEIPVVLRSVRILDNSEYRKPSQGLVTFEAGDSATSAKLLENMHVLVVDDSRLNRKLLKRLLESQGHHCMEASNGLESLQSLDRAAIDQSTRFDVVLMDNNMPQMSGHQATQAMRLRGYTGVIIGVTGDTQQSEIISFLNQGADAVVTKPIDPAKLEDIIRTQFRRRKSSNCSGL